jgi:hypothetical protein
VTSTFKILIFITLSAPYLGCKSEIIKETESKKTTVNADSDGIQKVATTIVSSQTLKREKTYLGFLHNNKNIDFLSPVGGIITEWKVKASERVLANAFVVKIVDPFLEYEKMALEADERRSIFEQNELLVSFGGQSGDITSVSSKVLENIYNKTNYFTIRARKKKLELQEKLGRIFPTESGWIQSEYKILGSNISIGEKLFSFIPESSILIKIIIPQIEFSTLQIDQLFIIKERNSSWTTSATYQFAENLENSTMLEIYLKPKLLPRGKFIKGLNVEASTSQLLTNALLVPRSAVVERDGYKTIFTFDGNSEKAIFNYVSVTDWDNEHYLVEKGISSGTEIIIEGNELLSHHSPVRKIK